MPTSGTGIGQPQGKVRRILFLPLAVWDKKEDSLKALVQNDSAPKKPNGFAVPNFATEKQRDVCSVPNTMFVATATPIVSSVGSADAQ